jgi:hypothetical protein
MACFEPSARCCAYLPPEFRHSSVKNIFHASLRCGRLKAPGCPRTETQSNVRLTYRIWPGIWRRFRGRIPAAGSDIGPTPPQGEGLVRPPRLAASGAREQDPSNHPEFWRAPGIGIALAMDRPILFRCPQTGVACLAPPLTCTTKAPAEAGAPACPPGLRLKKIRNDPDARAGSRRGRLG